MKRDVIIWRLYDKPRLASRRETLSAASRQLPRSGSQAPASLKPAGKSARLRCAKKCGHNLPHTTNIATVVDLIAAAHIPTTEIHGPCVA